MSKELDTTYYRFLSEVRAFLSKLLKNPVDAQPSKYLKDRDFTRKKLINELLSRDVIERHEKILDSTNSDEKEPKYVVKFKIHRKDFEKRIHRIYIKFFEKNVNESVEEMMAYHGSSNKFSRFKNKHYRALNGWGTYVTTDKKTGIGYSYAFDRSNPDETGYLYEVEIPEDTGNNYLCQGDTDESKYDRVYQILLKAFPKEKEWLYNEIAWCKRRKDYYPLLAGNDHIKDKAVSLLLSKNGIVGYRYNNVPGYNYVIFDRRNVKIINRVQTPKRSSMVAESVFENEEEMKQQILNGPDGDVYRKRGGINEDGEGGGMSAGGDGSGGATSTSSVASETTRGDVGYDAPFGMVRRAGYLADRKKKKDEPKPENILGKTIMAEKKKGRRIFVTEEQFNRILEEEGLGAGGATTTTSVASETSDGQLGPVRPGCMTFKKSNGKPDDSAFERKPGFSVRRIGEKK